MKNTYIHVARGGVLFVDEAYTLAPLGGAETKDFGREVSDTHTRTHA
jgi:hypothetical protein